MIIDKIVIDFFTNIRTDFLTVIMKTFSFIGSFYGISVIILLFYILKKDNVSKLLLKHTIIITILNNILKFIFQRERPPFPMVKENSFSFPSGHSMIGTFVFGFFVIYIIKNKNLSILKKLILSIICILLCIGIIVSRLYLGVHYFTDVLAGALLSLLYLISIHEKINIIIFKD